MSYLFCEKCGGYYKLKEGQSPDDFEFCECGGDLKYVQDFNMHFDEEMDPLNELTTCPNCGVEISAGEKLCKSCSDIETKTNEKTSFNSKEVVKESSNKKWAINLMGVIVGVLIVLIPNFLMVDGNYILLLLVIGGLVASLIVRGNNEDKTLNGTLAGLIAGLILLIFRSNIEFSNGLSYVTVFIYEIVGPLLILTLFGFIGGLIGIFLRWVFVRYR